MDTPRCSVCGSVSPVRLNDRTHEPTTKGHCLNSSCLAFRKPQDFATGKIG